MNHEEIMEMLAQDEKSTVNGMHVDCDSIEERHISSAARGMDHVHNILLKDRKDKSTHFFHYLFDHDCADATEDYDEMERKLNTNDPDIVNKLNLVSLPMFDSQHRSGGLRQGKKIVNYSLASLQFYHSLVIFSRTIYSNADTYYVFLAQGVIAIVTYVVSYYSGAARSVPINTTENFLQSRLDVLLGFVLAGYVGWFVDYYFKVRHDCVSPVQECCEAINMYMSWVLRGNENLKFRMHLLRLTRMVMALLFLASDGKSDLTMLYASKLLTKGSTEDKWIENCPTSYRQYLVIGWVQKFVDTVFMEGGAVHHPAGFTGKERLQSDVYRKIDLLRWRCGDTISWVTTPMPFMYAHLVTWIVKCLLFLIAVQTGLYCASCRSRFYNGNDEYDNGGDDSIDHFPASGTIWYFNAVAVRVVGNIIFALFIEGLLKVCEHVQNPVSENLFGLPEFVYSADLHNSVTAMAAGFEHSDAILEEIFDSSEKDKSWLENKNLTGKQLKKAGRV